MPALIPNGSFAAYAAEQCEQKTVLSQQDKQFLDKLIAEFLFDPKGAQRVLIKNAERDVWGAVHQATAAGWLVPGDGTKAAMVFLADGFPIPLQNDNDLTTVDFVASAEAWYDAAQKQNDSGHIRPDALAPDDLAAAAWLHQLSHDDLAPKALAAARKCEPDPRKKLREELAWSAFADMVHAYMVRADDEALVHGEHLLRLYPEEAQKQFPQAAQIVKELERRHQIGARTWQVANEPPADFKLWDTKKKSGFFARCSGRN